MNINNGEPLLIYNNGPAVACADGFDRSAGEAVCLEVGFTGLDRITRV